MAVEAVADREMFIDGGPVPALGGQWIDVPNPATGEIVARVPAGGVDDVDRAVRAARRPLAIGAGEASRRANAQGS